MSSKFIILITCSSFLRAFGEEYMLMPPNHRLDDEGPFNLYYYVPTIINEQPLKIRSMNDARIGRVPSRLMKPPNPYAKSNYNDYHGLPIADITDEVPYNHKKNRDERPKYTREHDPFTQSSESENQKSQEVKVKRRKKLKKRPTDELELSTDGDRVDFQIQGQDGPETYIFGFDTGDGKNRQFRLEQKLPDGSVKGHYGYYDARGKLRTVRYLSQPSVGYTEKHHESNKESTEDE